MPVLGQENLQLARVGLIDRRSQHSGDFGPIPPVSASVLVARTRRNSLHA
jgi:hypothetical protein